MSVAGLLDAMRSNRKFSERLVWQSLENHANGDRRWCISIERIAAELHMSPGTVVDAIKGLETDKIVRVERARRKTSTYLMLRSYQPENAQRQDEVAPPVSPLVAEIGIVSTPEPVAIERVLDSKTWNVNPPRENPPKEDVSQKAAPRLFDDLPPDPTREPSDAAAMTSLVEDWNAMAYRAGLSVVRLPLSSSRRGKMLARLHEHQIAGLKEAIENVGKSSYCRGEVNGWKGDFDWFVQEVSCRRARQGYYNDRRQAKLVDPWAATMARLVPEPMR